MIGFPNAKINLGLNVIARREDGYHDLETIFYPVKLSDILEVLPGDQFHFETSGIALDADAEKNLVVKAYRLLSDAFDLAPVKIHLHKVIPFGAGLGGGSSDAAYMLKMLNILFGLRLDNHQLKEFASVLGADCPFFIENIPAFATGIGDQLSPIEIDLCDFNLIIVKPRIGVDTVQAYKAIKPDIPRNRIAEIIRQPIEDWKYLLINDFEMPVFSMFPEIAQIKHKLYELGAVFASMSGSGAAVYGLFRKIPPQITSQFGSEYFLYLGDRCESD